MLDNGRMINFAFLPSTRLLAPVPIESSRLEKQTDLHGYLYLIAPLKRHHFEQCEKRTLSIFCRPNAPFGPDPDALVDHLFSDFRKSVIEARDAFALKKIEIIGLGSEKRFRESGVRFLKSKRRRNKKEIHIDLVEFKRLHTARIHGERTNPVSVSVFIDFDQIPSFIVPEGTPLKEVLYSDDAVKQYVRDHPERTPYNPVSRERFDLENTACGPGTALVCFAGSGFSPAPPGDPIFAFPYYSRSVSMRAGNDADMDTLPCNNCLGCSTYCPADLYPSTLYHYITRGSVDEALKLNARACIQCGNCSFVCPCNIPLHREISAALNNLGE